MKTTHPRRPPPRVPSGDVLLRVERLAVSYGGIRALKGVDLEVRRGEIVAMIGATGAGKTTTLKTIARLLPIAAGSITYDGRSLAHLGPEEVVETGISPAPATEIVLR